MYVKRNPSLLKPMTVNVKFRVPCKDSKTRIQKGRFICMENFWDTDVTKAPLNRRAWVYQERVLSPRVLHLSAHQAFWECSEVEACETSPNGLPTALKCHFKSRMADLICKSRFATSPLGLSSDKESAAGSIDLENKMLELWWRVVGDYNRGGLTKHEDKFIAIAGVAKEIQVHLNDEYVAGLWKKHLLQHLTWAVAPFEADGNWGWEQSRRPQAYQAPSWSWASVNERIRHIGGFYSKALASVIDFKVTLASTSEFGHIIDGYVRIWGRLTQATFQASDKSLRQAPEVGNPVLKLRTSSSKHTLVVPFLSPDIRVCVPNDAQSGSPSYPVRDAIGSRDFYLLPLCENETIWIGGLLLQRTKLGTRGQYQGLGMFSQFKEDVKSFEAFQSHIPFLDVQDYEKRDDHEFTISII